MPEVPRAVAALVGLPDTTLLDHHREEARLRPAAINELLTDERRLAWPGEQMRSGPVVLAR